jgi:hypothetical protein
VVLQYPELPPPAAGSWPEPAAPSRRPGPSSPSAPSGSPGGGQAVRERPAAYSARAAGGLSQARLSAGLCRLLNAVVIYPDLRAIFLESPLEAASLASRESATLLGHRLPDPSLRMPPIALEEADWVLLRRLAPCRTLAEAAHQLSSLAAPAAAPGAVEAPAEQQDDQRDE